jgi:hypothetical protein
MASTYGAKRGFPDFDKFKTGMSYQDFAAMLWVDSDNPDDWKRKSNGVVLALAHKLKVEMYEAATGINVDRDSPADVQAITTEPLYRLAAETLAPSGRDEEEPAYRVAT